MQPSVIPVHRAPSRWLVLAAGLAAAACSTDAVVDRQGAGGTSATTSAGSATSTTTGATTAETASAGPATGGTTVGSSAVTGGSAGTTGTATSGGGSGGGEAGAGQGGGGGSGIGGTGGSASLGPAAFQAGDLDDPSNGGTITFQNIGKAGWFPSRRDPATGPCDFANTNGCCKTKLDITSDKLTPWDEDLIMTLRGPLVVKQLVAYEPAPSGTTTWEMVSSWDDRARANAKGLGFNGNQTETRGFAGTIGTECLVDVSTDRSFACGPGSIPYCPPSGTIKKYYGWPGSKMIVLLAAMPYADSGKIAAACSQNTTGNWYNAPWVGLSHGELVRAGAFGSCQCYSATDPNAGDGCGQFNVFETVNDNNTFRNFDVFSTNFFGYGGYVGEGPCGTACKASLFPNEADLVAKATSLEVPAGVVTGPGKPVGAAFRRPSKGYRYFVMLLDVDTRTVQLAIVHPLKIPASLAGFLPNFPLQIPRSTVDAVLGARLPR